MTPKMQAMLDRMVHERSVYAGAGTGRAGVLNALAKRGLVRRSHQGGPWYPTEEGRKLATSPTRSVKEDNNV